MSPSCPINATPYWLVGDWFLPPPHQVWRWSAWRARVPSSLTEWPMRAAAGADANVDVTLIGGRAASRPVPSVPPPHSSFFEFFRYILANPRGPMEGSLLLHLQVCNEKRPSSTHFLWVSSLLFWIQKVVTRRSLLAANCALAGRLEGSPRASSGVLLLLRPDSRPLPSERDSARLPLMGAPTGDKRCSLRKTGKTENQKGSYRERLREGVH